MTDRAVETPVEVTVNGRPRTATQGRRLLDVLADCGIDTPTLCFSPTMDPANACRVCVVEVDGSGPLVPSCSRAVDDGMVVQTDSDRVRHARKMVLEFLGSGTDLSQTTELHRWIDHYGADPERYGPDQRRIDEPVKIQDKLYIRDYDKCVLCYQCVDACGDQAQHTYAIAVAGRGFDARISTEYDAALPDSACVYCGNCIGVCPTGAIQFKSEFDLRQTGQWRPEEQTVTSTICSYCGVGCTLEVHVQNETIVKVTSPNDHDVTSGHLCVKGRFGWQYVQPRPDR